MVFIQTRTRAHIGKGILWKEKHKCHFNTFRKAILTVIYISRINLPTIRKSWKTVRRHFDFKVPFERNLMSHCHSQIRRCKIFPQLWSFQLKMNRLFCFDSSSNDIFYHLVNIIDKKIHGGEDKDKNREVKRRIFKLL